MANFIISKTMCIVFLSLLATGQSWLNLNCLEDNKQCSLVSKDDPSSSLEVKALALKCMNEDCKESVVLGDNNELYLCVHLNKRFGECQHLINKNSLKSQTNSVNLIENGDDTNSDENVSDEEEINKRQLPFETLNYGRKRQLPFETLNFGKRRYLPFETMLYGRKRSLPFETLNYGKKRAYIPIDGYIMGRR